MTDDELWAAIDAQRSRVADLIDDLTEDEWDRPSLCEGWTVRDVAAHLTLQQSTFRDLLPFLLRHPGGTNALIRESSKDVSRRLPKESFAPTIRAMIGSRRHNVGVTPQETLIDILVHGQDIAIPLGRTLELPVEPTVWAADRVWSYGGKGKSSVFHNLPLFDLTLRATDVDWTVGSGPELRGPIGALLLVLTGRRVGLTELSGEAVEGLARA